jgi:predicted anti-sigma-YlaC factor YlaD
MEPPMPRPDRQAASHDPPRRAALALLLALAVAATPGCSIKRWAVGSVGNTIAGGPDVFATDDDPELVRDAVPFGLKTMESLLAVVPRHEGLLLALTRGYTQYAYAFVQSDADLIESTDYARAVELRERALKLYLRAQGFGLRGLERRYRGISQQLQLEPERAAGRIQARDVAMLYWTAAAWGSAISLGKDRADLLADLPAIRALMQRGLALDEAYDAGAFHEAMILLEALPAAMGGSVERARQHFERALALSKGFRASPYVTMAQSVSVLTQNRREFDELLGHALDVDPNRDPTQRLATVVLQRKARALRERQDELFLDDVAAPDSTASDTTLHEER